MTTVGGMGAPDVPAGGLSEAVMAAARREPRFVAVPDPADAFKPLGDVLRDVDGVLRANGADPVQQRIGALSLGYRLGLVVTPAIAALALERRLPDLSPGSILVAGPARRPIDRFTLSGARFACLAGDPAAARGEAEILETVTELRERFHATYTTGWLAGTVAAIARLSPVNEKALWGMVASGWATAGEHVAAGTGDARLGRAEVDALSDGHPGLRTNPLAFYEPAGDPSRPLRHWRGVCCLAYRNPGEEKCPGNCPLLPEGRAALRDAGWMGAAGTVQASA